MSELANIKMVAIDLDGTLLRSNQTISDRTMKALRETYRSGRSIVLCTGRGLPQTIKVIGGIQLEMPIVLHNGAMIAQYPQMNVIRYIPLDAVDARRSIELMESTEMVPNIYDWNRGEHLLVTPHNKQLNPALRRYLENKDGELLRVDDIKGYVDHHVTEIFTIDRRRTVLDSLQKIKDSLPGVTCLTSGRVYSEEYWFLEILNRRSSKSEALRYLSGKHGITSEQVLAIGDNYNDLDMFDYAGVSVAMGNAPAEVQLKADWTAPTNNDDGVADVLEKLLNL